LTETMLKLIPAYPEYTPSNSSQSNLINKLKVIFVNSEIKDKLYDHVQFIDQGGNFELIKCPNCQEEIAIGWWQEKMDKAYKVNFENLSLILPCCNGASNLNELEYILPAGFARFVVEILNAESIEYNINQHLKELEKLIGSKLKVIIVRY